nr:MAG TPA: hypothetical protein [Caudoviricetes sp.]
MLRPASGIRIALAWLVAPKGVGVRFPRRVLGPSVGRVV